MHYTRNACASHVQNLTIVQIQVCDQQLVTRPHRHEKWENCGLAHCLDVGAAIHETRPQQPVVVVVEVEDNRHDKSLGMLARSVTLEPNLRARQIAEGKVSARAEEAAEYNERKKPLTTIRGRTVHVRAMSGKPLTAAAD